MRPCDFGRAGASASHSEQPARRYGPALAHGDTAEPTSGGVRTAMVANSSTQAAFGRIIFRILVRVFYLHGRLPHRRGAAGVPSTTPRRPSSPRANPRETALDTMTSMQRGVLDPAQIASTTNPVPLPYQAGHRWRGVRLAPAIGRLARHLGVTRRELLERLIVVGRRYDHITELHPRSSE